MFCGLAFVVAVAASAAKAPEGPPADLIGTWEVVHVAVDMADQPHWKHRPEDPSLIGRELVIGAEQVRFADFRETHCEPASWKRESWTWKNLVDNVFLGPKSTATPADWRVKAPAKGKMVVHVPCGQSETWQRASWLVTVGPDLAIMELDPETVLFLARRKSDAKPKPSFSCAKASTASEKAICDSFVLSAWDRSVALAWQKAQEAGINDSIDEQKAWLKTRDACAADAVCLEAAMKQRANKLSRF